MNDDAVNKEKVNGSDLSNVDGFSNKLSSMNIDNNSSKKKKDTCLCCLKAVEAVHDALNVEQLFTVVCPWTVHKNICQDSNNAKDSDEKLQMKAMNHLNQSNN